MSSTVSPAAWMQAALARSVHATAAPTTGGRHRAPETADSVEYLTSEQIANGQIASEYGRHAATGRHAEPEWTRQAFDPTRDDVDAFDWLGFEARQD